MPERGGVATTVITAGLICVGGAVAWLSVAIVVAVGFGRVVRLSDGGEQPSVDTLGDLEEIWAQEEAPAEPLLGVAQPPER